MGRIRPISRRVLVPSSASDEREKFTIWMKSLIFHGSGCAAYDSNGRLAFRVDNYGNKNHDSIYLMDLYGNVLFKILKKKKLGIVRGWEGYRCGGCKEEEPAFRVLKSGEMVVFGEGGCRYRIEGEVKKSKYKIIGDGGEMMAEVERKRGAAGVVLGEDVVAMVVEPSSDISLVMAFVVVCSRISHTM